jgi:hypothetical protein
MPKLELKVVDHENNIGQTINPGDEVVIVTSGYNHSVSIKRGTYLGKKNKGCSCRVVESNTKYRFKETGEDVGHWWHDHARKRGVMPERPVQPIYPRSARWGSPEYSEQQEEIRKLSSKYSEEYSQYNEKVRKIGEDYESFKVPYDRYTTLQLNRIYKLDTKAYEIKV